jgi:hypothetical protein
MVSTPAGNKSFLLLFFKKACPGLEPGKRLLFYSFRVAARKAWMPAFAGMTG